MNAHVYLFTYLYLSFVSEFLLGTECKTNENILKET